MRTPPSLVGLLGALFLFTVASSDQSMTSAAGTESAGDTLRAGNTQFALELYKEIAAEEGNAVASPLSISIASALLYAGSSGETEAEIASALHFRLSQNKLHGEFADLLRELHTRVARWAKLSFANGLWIDDDCSLVPEYSDLLSRRYGAEAQTVDFGGAPLDACAAINGWVSTETHGKITSVVAPEMFTSLTRATLVNTVYFLAAWDHGFAANKTQQEPFHRPDGSTVQTDMMHQRGTPRYYADETVQVLELRYQGSGLSMLVVLPRPDTGLSSLEAQLTAARLSSWVDGLERRGVDTAIPRFEIAWRIDLIPVLKNLGMMRVFESGRADLSGVCADPRLYVDHAAHHVTLGITERGTEAAAATVYVVTLGAHALPQAAVSFRADRPFMYVIRDMEHGAILFIGRVVDPTT